MLGWTPRYTCLLNGPVIEDPIAPTIIEGIHLNNKTNADVQEIEVRYFNFSHIPMELFETFPNARDVKFQAGFLGRLDQFQHCEGIHSLILHAMLNVLNQTIPENLLENCKNLVNLEIWQNQFSEISIPALPSLTSLDLMKNQLRKFNVAGLRNLKTLTLDLNQIETLHAENFVGLENLSKLNLSRNRISVIHEGTFAPLINLNQMFMENNLMIKLESHLLQSNLKLKAVAFSGNRIEVIEDGVFNDLPDLKLLALSGNVCIDESFSFGNGQNVTSILPALKPCLPQN